MRTHIYIIITFFIITSCNSQKKGKSNKMGSVPPLTSITCYLMSLDGEKKIYTIQMNNIIAFGKQKELNAEDCKKIMTPPSIIYNNGLKYGCGVCTDQVDYKFVFKYDKKQTVWEIELGSKLPQEINEYFNLLIKKYDELLIN